MSRKIEFPDGVIYQGHFLDVLPSGTILRDGRPSDWLYIDHLRKKEGDSLGFVPKDAYLSILEKKPYGGRYRFLYSGILITEDNGQQTGFCYFSILPPWAKVFQIVVQEDARRWYRATFMLQEVERRAKENGCVGVKCRVAVDLEANFFWRAMGYEPVKVVTSTWLNQRLSRSGRLLWVYRKYLRTVPQQLSLGLV